MGSVPAIAVHGLLGRRSDTVQAHVGGGYYRERRTLEDVAAELRGYVDAGFGLVKIPAGGLAPRDEEAWVTAAREAIGPDVDLAIDTHWTWSDVRSARRVLERLDDLRLDWVEDPLWPEALPAAAELRRHIRSPIAIGDELSGRWAYQQMLEPRAADIWRLDVTTVGGFTEARRILGLASAFGIPVSPHIYVELHVHLAASDAGRHLGRVRDPGVRDRPQPPLHRRAADAGGRTVAGADRARARHRRRSRPHPVDRGGVLRTMTTARRPTLDDVAAHAGVSRSTVSRVINAHAYVTDEVRQAVLRAIDEIGYVPNESARALRTNRTMTVGLVVTRLRNQVFAAIAQSLDEALMAAGRTLLAGSSADDPQHEAHVVSAFLRRGVDGLVLTLVDERATALAPRPRRGRASRSCCSTGMRAGCPLTRSSAATTRASPPRSPSCGPTATSG